MPLLPEEPSLYPSDALGDEVCREGETARWWVLHTRPRVEKSLARRFFHAKQAFYLPLREHRWKGKGRTFTSYLPLFPGYVFLYGGDDARRRALETNLVAQVLFVSDPGQLHSDLQRVQRIISSGAPVAAEERLQPGSLVTITQGPLAGLTGTILRCDKNWRFTLAVRFLQQGVSLDIDGWMIEPASADAPTTIGA